MSKSGLYINGNKVCDINQNSVVQVIPKSFVGNSFCVNSFNNRGATIFKNNIHGNVGYINNSAHNGDISFQGSKIVVDDEGFKLKNSQIIKRLFKSKYLVMCNH